MAQATILLIFTLFLSVKCLSGEFLIAKLGDSVNLSASQNCTDGNEFTLRRGESTIPLARRVDGVWMSEPDYARAQHLSESVVVLSRLNFNDKGVYEFICQGKLNTYIQLEVFRGTPVSVFEEDTAELPCHYYTAGDSVKTVKSFRWERNGTLVMEVDRALQVIYGTGFEGKVSVSDTWFEDGNLSLTLKPAQPGDTGDYICYIQKDVEDAKRRRENPADVATLTVGQKPDRTSCAPECIAIDKEKKGMDAHYIVIITATVTLVIVGLLAFGLGWWVKSCISKTAQGPDARAANVEIPLVTNGDLPGPHINRGTVNGHDTSS